jgi:hypothetical protein
MADGDELKPRVLKQVKLSAVGVEIIGIIVLVFAFFLLAKHHIIELPELFACQIPVLDMSSGAMDPELSLDENIGKICDANIIIKLAAVVSLPYLFLCILLISSPLKSSPVMYFFKTYLLNEEGGQPKFHEAMRLILFSRAALPFYYAYFYCGYYGFVLGLHPLMNLSFSLAGFSSLLLVLEVFQKSDLVWEERISGLRIYMKDEKLAKVIKEKNRWCNKTADKLGMGKIGPIIGLLLWGFLTINVLRDGMPPKDYDEVVYQRPSPAWEDNAYFALAGLDAPEDVEDFYNYGREEAIYNSRVFMRYKEELGVPFHDVPEVAYSLYQPGRKDGGLRFDAGDLDKWWCLYNIEAKESASDCPDKEEVLALIDKNTELWRRFRELPSYSFFSIPDVFIGDYYSGQDLIGLARLNAVYILDLQEKGHSDEAIREWRRYWDLYLKMLHTHTNMVEKVVFLVLTGVQFDVLEMLLYNEPDLAIQYGDQIKEALDITDVNFFRAGFLIADEWRGLETYMLGTMGSMPYHRRLMRQCIAEYERVGKLSADEYLRHYDHKMCMDIYPRDNEFVVSLISPGNPITNIIQYLLMGGVVKGGEIIANMHEAISDYKKVIVAIELIRNKVAPENVQSYVDEMGEDYFDPITKAPFLWNDEKQVLYTPNIDDPTLEPLRTFRVRLVQ